MKKIIMYSFLPWLFVIFGYKAMAQEGAEQKSKEKVEAEEIIIRKKGAKDANVNIQINGDNVTINGKPLAEYKDENITINKRKMIVRNGDERTVIIGDNDMGDAPMAWGFNNGEATAFLGVNTEKTEDGAKITEEISKETAAGKAGLQKGDIITKFDGKKIEGPQSLYEAVNAKKPKDEVKINYMRDGKEKSTKAVLGERKGSISKSYSFSGPDGSFKSFTMPYRFDGDQLRSLEQLRGLEELQELGNYDFNYNFPGKQKLGIKIQDTEEGNGVRILEVEDSSAAAIAGLKKDDIITEVGFEKVTNTDEAREQLQENREKGTYPIKVRRAGSELNFTIKIPKKLKTTNL